MCRVYQSLTLPASPQPQGRAYAALRWEVTTDLSAPGWRLHELKTDLRGYHSVTVNGNWRIIFQFVGTDVELVDDLDYH